MCKERELKIIEGEIVPIYENKKGERLINARELHKILENKRKFADWIKQRIEHYKFAEYQDFFTFHNFVKCDQKDNLGTKTKEYYISIDMAKELCMVENNETGRKMRKNSNCTRYLKRKSILSSVLQTKGGKGNNRMV